MRYTGPINLKFNGESLGEDVKYIQQARTFLGTMMTIFSDDSVGKAWTKTLPDGTVINALVPATGMLPMVNIVAPFSVESAPEEEVLHEEYSYLCHYTGTEFAIFKYGSNLEDPIRTTDWGDFTLYKTSMINNESLFWIWSGKVYRQVGTGPGVLIINNPQKGSVFYRVTLSSTHIIVFRGDVGSLVMDLYSYGGSLQETIPLPITDLLNPATVGTYPARFYVNDKIVAYYDDQSYLDGPTTKGNFAIRVADYEGNLLYNMEGDPVQFTQSFFLAMRREGLEIMREKEPGPSGWEFYLKMINNSGEVIAEDLVIPGFRRQTIDDDHNGLARTRALGSTKHHIYCYLLRYNEISTDYEGECHVYQRSSDGVSELKKILHTPPYVDDGWIYSLPFLSAGYEANMDTQYFPLKYGQSPYFVTN